MHTPPGLGDPRFEKLTKGEPPDWIPMKLVGLFTSFLAIIASCRRAGGAT
jgi:hypothetical protein